MDRLAALWWLGLPMPGIPDGKGGTRVPSDAEMFVHVFVKGLDVRQIGMSEGGKSGSSESGRDGESGGERNGEKLGEMLLKLFKSSEKGKDGGTGGVEEGKGVMMIERDGSSKEVDLAEVEAELAAYLDSASKKAAEGRREQGDIGTGESRNGSSSSSSSSRSGGSSSSSSGSGSSSGGSSTGRRGSSGGDGGSSGGKGLFGFGGEVARGLADAVQWFQSAELKAPSPGIKDEPLDVQGASNEADYKGYNEAGGDEGELAAGWDSSEEVRGEGDGGSGQRRRAGVESGSGELERRRGEEEERIGANVLGEAEESEEEENAGWVAIERDNEGRIGVEDGEADAAGEPLEGQGEGRQGAVRQGGEEGVWEDGVGERREGDGDGGEGVLGEGRREGQEGGMGEGKRQMGEGGETSEGESETSEELEPVKMEYGGDKVGKVDGGGNGLGAGGSLDVEELRVVDLGQVALLLGAIEGLKEVRDLPKLMSWLGGVSQGEGGEVGRAEVDQASDDVTLGSAEVSQVLYELAIAEESEKALALLRWMEERREREWEGMSTDQRRKIVEEERAREARSLERGMQRGGEGI
ncbi:unnamed protein product [Closterium sp. Naga37s-1]|nr:unnamed protein product [Closterium sp. Naga37s-1]